MVPLALVVLAVAGLVGLCSFNPGGPAVDRAAAPAVDAPRELTRVAREVDFPLRSPAVPDGWSASAFLVLPVDSDDDDKGSIVRVGWLLPESGYARLGQSGATELDLARAETGQDAPIAAGAVEIGGRTWVAYRGVRDEPVWITEIDGARLAVTGSAGEAGLRALAEAALTADPLPTG